MDDIFKNFTCNPYIVQNFWSEFGEKMVFFAFVIFLKWKFQTPVEFKNTFTRLHI